jgi:hypothetical protein
MEKEKKALKIQKMSESYEKMVKYDLNKHKEMLKISLV